jgi:hypothetical protein
MVDLSEDIIAAAQRYQHLVAIEATFKSNGTCEPPIDKINQALKGRDYLMSIAPNCITLAGLAYKGSLSVDSNDFRRLSMVLPISSFDNSCLDAAAAKILEISTTSTADRTLLSSMTDLCDKVRYTLTDILDPPKECKRDLKQVLDAHCPLHKRGMGALKGLLFEFYVAETIRKHLTAERVDHEIFNRVPYTNGEHGDIDVVVACDEKGFRRIHDHLSMIFIRKPKCNGRHRRNFHSRVRDSTPSESYPHIRT